MLEHTYNDFVTSDCFYLEALIKGCLPKNKIAEKETLVHTGGRGVKNPLFLVQQKGDVSLRREGSKSFCHIFHVHFCVSVSTQLVAFFEDLHYENSLYHVIKYLTCLPFRKL